VRSKLDESWGGKSIFVHFYAETEREEAKDLRLKERKKTKKLQKFLREFQNFSRLLFVCLRFHANLSASLSFGTHAFTRPSPKPL
jgi:hypothetical protein